MWIDDIRSRIQEHERLEESDIVECIDQALGEYSGYFPKTSETDIPSDESYTYAMPGDWTTGFSYIVRVEYPLTEDLLVDNPESYPIPAIREPSDYQISDLGVTKLLYAFFEVPTGESIRMRYVVPYTYDDASSVPSHHTGAVVNLATSYALCKMAAVYSQSVYYELEAEAVDYKSRASDYLKQASWYRKRYEEVLGIEGSTKGTLVDGEQENFGESTAQLKELEVDYTHRMFRPSYYRVAPITYQGF